MRSVRGQNLQLGDAQRVLYIEYATLEVTADGLAALVRSGTAARRSLRLLDRHFDSCNTLTIASVDEKERGNDVLQGTISAAVPRAVDGWRVCCWPWQRHKTVSPCC